MIAARSAVAALLLAAAPAWAQADRCTLPSGLAPAPSLPWSEADARPAKVLGYVLALSWSPEFCAHASGKGDAGQCRDNRFGFVVHGLWPQGQGRNEPQSCTDDPPIPADVVRQHFCMTPSPRLMQHEWAKHGTCGWTSGADYLAAAARLWRSLRLPDPEAMPQPSAGALRDAFAAANPGLPRDAVFVVVGSRRALSEIRLCANLSMRWTPCPDGRVGAPDSLAIKVRPRS